MVLSSHFFKNIYLLIALLLLVSAPFLYSSEMYDGYKLIKPLALIISVALLLLYRVCISKAMVFRFHAISIGVTSFALYSFVPPLIKDPSIMLNMEYISNISIIILYYLMLGLFVKNKLQTAIVYLLVISSLALSVWGLLQWLNLTPSASAQFKITGPFLNPGPYSCLLSLSLTAPLSIAILGRSHMRNLVSVRHINIFEVLCYTTVLLGCIALSVTTIRTSWISIIFIIPFLFIIRGASAPNKISIKMKVQVGVLVLAVALIGCVLGYFSKRESSQGRVLIWKVSLQECKNRMLGNGYSFFKREYNTLQCNYFKKHRSSDSIEAMRAGNVSYCYNEGLELFVNYGIIGCVIALVVIILIIKVYLANYKSKDLFFHLAFVGILSTLIHSVTSYPFSMIGNKTYTMIFLALYVSLDSNKKVCSYQTMMVQRLAKIFIPLLSAVLLYNACLIFKRYQIWTQADLMFKRLNDSNSAAEILQSQIGNSHEGELLLYYGKILFLCRRYNEASFILEKAKSYISDPLLFYTLGQCYSFMDKDKLSESNFDDAINICPNSLYPRYLLFLHYVRKNKRKQATDTANEIVNMRVKIYSEAVSDIKDNAQRYLNGEVITTDF